MDKFSKTEEKTKSKTRQKLRLTFAVICLLMCACTLSSCTARISDPLEYRAYGFSAEISASGEGVDFDAIIEFSPSRPDGKRDLSVHFLSPESIKGLSVCQSGDTLSVRLGEIEFDGLDPSIFSELRLFRIARMLLPEEPIRSILSIRGAECGLPQIDSLTAVTSGDTVIYIEPSSGLPIKATDLKNGEHVTIRSFSVITQPTQ